MIMDTEPLPTDLYRQLVQPHQQIGKEIDYCRRESIETSLAAARKLVNGFDAIKNAQETSHWLLENAIPDSSQFFPQLKAILYNLPDTAIEDVAQALSRANTVSGFARNTDLHEFIDTHRLLLTQRAVIPLLWIGTRYEQKEDRACLQRVAGLRLVSPKEWSEWFRSLNSSEDSFSPR
jgi:hypothetical protein